AMRPLSNPPSAPARVSPIQGLALRRRIADAVKVKVGSRKLAVGLIVVSMIGTVLLMARSGTKVFQAVATPDWRYLLAGLAICAAVQPLRALAWTSTVRSPVGFRAMYAGSSVGSVLHTLLPGRVGGASEGAALEVAAAPRLAGFFSL